MWKDGDQGAATALIAALIPLDDEILSASVFLSMRTAANQNGTEE